MAKAKVVLMDYNGQASQRPREIFLTADRGPYLRRLRWRRWGRARSTARGQEVTCIPDCFGRRTVLAVRVVVRALRPCPKRKARAYTAGTIFFGRRPPGVPRSEPLAQGYPTGCR